MANSDSEDFESADEEVVKPVEYRDQSHQKHSAASTEVEETSPSRTASQETAATPSSTASSQSAIVPNPDSLGAKPKLPLKSKSKPQAKHRGSKDSQDGVLNSGSSIAEGQKKRAPGKLGVKIAPSSILPSEIVAPDSKEFQGKSKVSWSGDVSDDKTENKDCHDPIQPLLEKLSSLDVVDTPDEVCINPKKKNF